MTLRAKLLATSGLHHAGRTPFDMQPVPQARIAWIEDGEPYEKRYYAPEMLAWCELADALADAIAHYGLPNAPR